jgi:hypothetical protein
MPHRDTVNRKLSTRNSGKLFVISSGHANQPPNREKSPSKNLPLRCHCRPRCPPGTLASFHAPPLCSTLERSSCISSPPRAPNAASSKSPPWASLASSPVFSPAATTHPITPQPPLAPPTLRSPATPSTPTPLPRLSPFPRALTQPKSRPSNIHPQPAGSSTDLYAPYPR